MSQNDKQVKNAKSIIVAVALLHKALMQGRIKKELQSPEKFRQAVRVLKDYYDKHKNQEPKKLLFDLLRLERSFVDPFDRNSGNNDHMLEHYHQRYINRYIPSQYVAPVRQRKNNEKQPTVAVQQLNVRPRKRIAKVILPDYPMRRSMRVRR